MGAQRQHTLWKVFTKKGFITARRYPSVVPYTNIRFKSRQEALNWVKQLQLDDAKNIRYIVALERMMQRKPKVTRYLYEVVDNDPSIEDGSHLAGLLGKYIIMRHEEPVILKSYKPKAPLRTVHIGEEVFQI